jgi:hypothetical protein
VAGRNIYTYGNIIPLRNNTDTIGGVNRFFRNVYTNGIIGESRTVRVHANIIPGSTNYNIKENENGNFEWNEITSKQFGRLEKYVEQAYISRINTNNITINDNFDSYIRFLKQGNVPIIDKNGIRNFSYIGTLEDPIKEIYVDKLVVTNQYATYMADAIDLKYIPNNSMSPVFQQTRYYKLYTNTPGNNLRFVNIQLDYNLLTKTGKFNVYITSNKNYFAYTSEQLNTNNDLKYPIVKINYQYLMEQFGFNSIKFSHVGNVIDFEQGYDANKSVAVAIIVEELTDNSGLELKVNFKRIINKTSTIDRNKGIMINDLAGLKLSFDVIIDNIDTTKWSK